MLKEAQNNPSCQRRMKMPSKPKTSPKFPRKPNTSNVPKYTPPKGPKGGKFTDRRTEDPSRISTR